MQVHRSAGEYACAPASLPVHRHHAPSSEHDFIVKNCDISGKILPDRSRVLNPWHVSCTAPKLPRELSCPGRSRKARPRRKQQRITTFRRHSLRSLSENRRVEHQRIRRNAIAWLVAEQRALRIGDLPAPAAAGQAHLRVVGPTDRQLNHRRPLPCL